MPDRLIECVPNFSEGRDRSIIKQITDQIEAVEGVTLLDVDPGRATNRTVVTLVGAPEPVLEAAFLAAKKASELIDMSKHRGEHPRMGATDVCPLVPVRNVTMQETVAYARRLAERMGEELGIPIYCYEHAALREDRRNLAAVRAGEYEALEEKLRQERWKPDFGPAVFKPRAGATAVGARNFLVAYNVNLNTTSTRRANAIAFDVREKGRVKTQDGTPEGAPVLDEKGQKVWTPGALECVKGIGWFIEEYGVCQVSMNLTDIGVTPVHIAYDEVWKRAEARGVRVTGSELVGLIPLEAMLEAGRYFLRKQQRSLGLPDGELIRIAVKSMGLDELYPFKPEEKIIEYAIQHKKGKVAGLVDLTLTGFVHKTASEAPAPGGGSVAAAAGALGAALGTMVANLSSHKRGWEDRWEEFSDWAVKGKDLHEELLRLVDEDTNAFNRIMEAWRLPSGTREEKAAKEEAIQEATKGAIEVPLTVMEKAYESMQTIRAMAEFGLESSVSDAGVGALCARTAVMGAYLNVKINAGDVKDRDWMEDVLARGRQIQEKAIACEREILEIVDSKV